MSVWPWGPYVASASPLCKAIFLVDLAYVPDALVALQDVPFNTQMHVFYSPDTMPQLLDYRHLPESDAGRVFLHPILYGDTYTAIAMHAGKLHGRVSPDYGFIAVTQMSAALTELKWQLDAEARPLICVSMIPRIAMQRLLHDNVRLFDEPVAPPPMGYPGVSQPSGGATSAGSGAPGMQQLAQPPSSSQATVPFAHAVPAPQPTVQFLPSQMQGPPPQPQQPPQPMQPPPPPPPPSSSLLSGSWPSAPPPPPVVLGAATYPPAGYGYGASQPPPPPPPPPSQAAHYVPVQGVALPSALGPGASTTAATSASAGDPTTAGSGGSAGAGSSGRAVRFSLGGAATAGASAATSLPPPPPVPTAPVLLTVPAGALDVSADTITVVQPGSAVYVRPSGPPPLAGLSRRAEKLFTYLRRHRIGRPHSFRALVAVVRRVLHLDEVDAQAVVDELEAFNVLSYPVSTRRDRMPFTQDFPIAYNQALLDG